MTTPNQFDNMPAGLESPLSRSELVATTTAHAFTVTTRAILVTADGSLVMRLAGDTSDLTLTVTAGTFLPLRVTHIRVATTAAVLGLW